MRFRGALQHLLDELDEPVDPLYRASKIFDSSGSKDYLQRLRAEQPLIALQRAAKTLDRLRFKDALQHLLAKADDPGTTPFSGFYQRGRFRVKYALEHLLAEVDKPVNTLQRALKLPDLLGFNDGDPNKQDSRRKSSGTGDTKRHKGLKRGLSGTIDGLKVSALADTGAAQSVVSANFARARKLDVAGSPSSFKQGNSKLAHSLGTSKN